MIWKYMPFDETKDQVTTKGVLGSLSVAGLIVFALVAVIGITGALITNQVGMYARIGLAGMTISCGFAWMLGLKARALNTLIICFVIAGVVSLFI
jgi:hypothetical protein